MENKYTPLTSEEVKLREKQGKVNKTKKNTSRSFSKIIQSHTLTYFNLLNLILAGIVLYSGQYKNMTFMAVVIVNSLIGIFQEVRVKLLIDKLSLITASKATVIRDEEKQEIPIEKIVADDIIIFESGDQIPADCTVLESQGLRVNESMLTGESRSVRKKENDILFSGSFVVGGTCIARVDKVGDESYAATLSKKAKTKKRASSEMQRSIKKIIKVVSILIVPVGILLLYRQMNIDGMPLNDALVKMVAGVIGMIPEGLVLLTSLSLILGVGRLAKKRALVQEMEAIEALARVNVLCLDKTGTITTGELDVTDVASYGDFTVDDVNRVMRHAAYAFEDVNATQKALMAHFEKLDDWKADKKIPFTSETKYSAVSYGENGSYAIGAPEMLTQDSNIIEKVTAFTQNGLRVLMLAKCDEFDEGQNTVKNVVPMGFIIISDRIRPTAKATFDYFRSQGVGIKVISGDNAQTVSVIASRAGLEGADKYIDASKLPQDFEELKKEVVKYTVFGRVKPEQKNDIIKAYQAAGGIVGMVGDGVNDVLALKDADCALAMASGSAAAKSVAHIVLMDSDFSSMQNIVKEGRMIVSNIEKVSALYLTKTIYSFLLSVIFIIINRQYPFIPIQLSLLSMACIGVPSFFLAVEKTQDVTKGGFLRQVLKISLPAAVGMVVSLLATLAIGETLDYGSVMMSTLNLVVGSVISMNVLYRVSKPMNLTRAANFIFSLLILCGGFLLVPQFLGIEYMLQAKMLVAAPIALMTLLIVTLFVVLVKAYGQFKNSRLIRKVSEENQIL